jgi:hypothetical protein
MRFDVRSRVTVGLAVAGLLVSCSSGSNGSPRPTRSRPVTTTTVARTYSAHVVGEAEVDPAYRQGLARVDGGWIFSVNDGLFLTDEALHQKAKRVPAIPAEWKARGFDHIGDVDVAKGVVYAPLEQPDYERGQQAMLTYDAATLEYTGGLNVAQHENSFVTVDPATGIAYSMDRFGGDALLRYDVGAGWRPLAPLPMSMRVERVQGADVHGGAVWLSTDDATEGVYRVDLASGKVDALGSIGHVDGEGEGIDATPTPQGDLHVLSIDVKLTPVRLIELRVVATPASR